MTEFRKMAQNQAYLIQSQASGALIIHMLYLTIKDESLTERFYSCNLS